jgi:regulator of protease activity HflC (stomatin/prohibitin superfamily)
MSPAATVKLIVGGVLILAVIIIASSGTYIVQPGFRGIQVTLGKVSPDYKPEGFGFKMPLISTIITKEHTAQEIVQKRSEIKERFLVTAQDKIGKMLEVVDVVMEDISLSDRLEAAIERKMVQEQEADKAIFQQQQTQVEADTAIIRAKGEAEAIQIRGLALSENPAFIDLEIVESWNGITPRVVGGGSGGTDMLLPLGNLGNAPRPSEDKTADQP